MDSQDHGSSRDMLASLIRKGRPRVALDVDGVLAHTYHTMIDEWNREKGSSYQFKDMKEYDEMRSNFGMALDDFVRIYTMAWADKWVDIKPSVSEAQLRPLVDHFEVDIVSSRPAELVAPLQKWMSANFPSMTFNIVRASAKGKFDLDYDIYIDDGNPLADRFVEDGGKAGKRLILISAPFNENRGYDRHEGITVARDLGVAIGMLTSTAVAERAGDAQKVAEKSRD